MTNHQRVFVVTTQIREAEIGALRKRLGATAAVLTAPTAEAKAVVTGLGRKPSPEVVLAPVTYPDVDRGHRLDDLVRRHAVADRLRDVVVVADPATVTLLLRVIAPGQLASSGPVTLVSLPRASDPVPFGKVVIGGAVLAVLSGLVDPFLPLPFFLGLVMLIGLALLVWPRQRRNGQAVLLSVGVATIVALLGIASSARFPGGW